jgi:hypothetical protein
MVNQIAWYIDCELRPRLIRELNLPREDPGIWGWENWLRHKDRRKLTFAFRILATWGVGFVSLCGGVALALHKQSVVHWYDILAFATDLVVYGGLGALPGSWYRSNRISPAVETFPLTVHTPGAAAPQTAESTAGVG